MLKQFSGSFVRTSSPCCYDEVQRCEGRGSVVMRRDTRARLIAGFSAMLLMAIPLFSRAQELMRHLNLASPEMSQAEMSREDFERKLKLATADKPADFTGKRLNGLDLSGFDLSNVIFRAAKLNNANLAGANLEQAVFDQAWLLNADLTGANLKRARLFQTQLMNAKMDNADLSGASITANLSKASLVNAKFIGADLSADMRNQSMGLMRGVLRSARLTGADFTNANLFRADLEFASLANANLTGVNLKGALLGGADLSGAIVSGANFEGADVNSARLISLKGLETSNIDKADNYSSAIRN